MVLYTNGESEIDIEKKWIFSKAEWPIKGDIFNHVTDATHTAWALRDAANEADAIHVNNATGVTYSDFISQPMVCTLHHPLENALTRLYRHFRSVNYVCISEQQSEALGIDDATVIHHGLDTSFYELRKAKKGYLSFIGRIAPVKGVHTAIEVAQKAGIPLKIAGEVQPAFKDYFEAEIKPHIDGTFIEYIGEADMSAKNELLGDSLAMLFPIQWDEPFGLVMIEAMACGTPVLALPGGSVPEIVCDGLSGFVCKDAGQMVTRAQELQKTTLDAAKVRLYVEENFSIDRMVDAYYSLYTRLIAAQSANAPGRAVA